MIQIRETAGDTLQGAVDGINTYYTTTYEFNLDTVAVYVNGRLKIKDWDDGFYVRAPNVVIMKEPLLAGDSLEVEYRANVKTGGGADGGRPNPPQIEQRLPDINALQNLPDVESRNISPGLSGEGDLKSDVGTFEYRPVILRPQ